MTDANQADRVQSFSKSAKGPLSPIPYDPILYGDDTANELNEHEKGFEISLLQNDDKALVDDEIDLGSNGNFNAVAESYPFEMIVETKVCGPAYNRLSNANDRDSLRVKCSNNVGINFEGQVRKTDTTNTNEGYTRDEITFISVLEEKPIESYEEKVQPLSSKSIFKYIGPKAHQSHHLSTTDDVHGNLTVRKQLDGRLVYTAGSNFKAKNICKKDCSFDKNENETSLNSVMTLYRDRTLERYQSYFEKICAAPEKSNGFSGRIKHELRRRRTLVDSILRGARKQMTRLALNAKNASTKVEQLLEEEKIMEMTSLLFEAVDTKEVDMVKTCLSQGALVHTKRSKMHGRTPFQTMFVRLCHMDEGLEPCSKMRECEEIIDVLFSHGCDINEIDDAKSCNGWAPIHYASRYGKLKRVQWINSRKGNLESRTVSEQSPLMLACQSGRFEVVYYLIRNNANFRKKDNRGRTVLHYAALTGNKHLLKFLVQCGAANDKLEQSDDGESPLSICKNVCSECYEYLQKATLPRQSMSLQINRVTKEENKILKKIQL